MEQRGGTEPEPMARKRRPGHGRLRFLLFVELLAALAATVWWLHFDLHAFAPRVADKPKEARALSPKAEEGPAAAKERAGAGEPGSAAERAPSPKADDQRAAEERRIRVGDPGSVFDPTKFDDRFPDMKEWAKAGVRGGIPFREDTRIAKRIKPGDDIQAAIDAAAKAGGGVVLLAPGTYPLREVIDMRSGVILRGADRDRTVLENHDRTAFRKERQILTLAFPEVRRAGVEDLTMVHAAVKALDPKVYEGRYENNHRGIKDLHVGHVNIWMSEDCWIDNCRLLYAGTDPLIVWNSKHITLRDNLVSGSFNKGVGGNGYYMLRGSEYVLCFNETVKGLRHFTLQSGQKRSVVIDCDLETDLNFHSGDGGHNLVENCRVRVSKRHPWEPIARGFAKHPPPGEANILYRIDASKGGNKRMCRGVPCDPEGVFSIWTKWKRSMAYRLKVPPPRAGTFYAVTGERKRRVGGDEQDETMEFF